MTHISQMESHNVYFYSFLFFQILGTFLAYVIICVQFAQSNSNPQCETMSDVMVNTSQSKVTNVTDVS